MFVRDKKFLSAVFLSAAMLAAAPVCAEEAARVLHPEGKAVLFGVSGHDTVIDYVYDDEGTRIGHLPGSGWGGHAKLIDEDSLYLSEEDQLSIVRTRDLKTMATEGPEVQLWLVSADFYAALNPQNGLLTLNNAEGESLGEISVTGGAASAGFDRGFQSFGRIVEFPDAYLLIIGIDGKKNWIWFDRETRSARLETSEALLKMLDDDAMTVYAFGDYLAFFPEFRNTGVPGTVMTREGLVLMDNLDGTVTEKRPEAFLDSYLNYDFRYKENQLTGVWRSTGSGYDVYIPERLELLGTMEEKPDVNGGSCRGFFPGIASEALGGNICSGLVFDVDSLNYCPYAMTGNEVLILKDGALMSFPAQGTPYAVSSAYYVAEGDGTATVYRTSDRSIFASFGSSPHTCISLGDGGIAMDDEPVDPEKWWDRGRTIYDNEGNPQYHSNNPYLRAFYNGTWYENRGIYTGIIDSSGRWLLKDTMARE